MSDIVREGSVDAGMRHGYNGGLVVDVAESSLDRVQKVLAGISGGWQKAVGSALSRAAAAGKTVAKKAVTQEYTISQGEFLAQTKNINHYVLEGFGGVSVEFGYVGYVIPLMKFNTSMGRDGRVTTQVTRGGGKETLDRAFKAHMGQHIGIYERVGESRNPVKELYGPSTPQMMYSNEAVTDAVEEKMAETYEERIDHEMIRLLNGWGV